MKNLTLYGALKNSAEKYPSSPALYYMGKSIKYKKLLSEVDKVARYIESRGIKSGDAVTICMPNIPQCVVFFYAVNKIGAVAHMVHPLAPTQRLLEYMQRVKSKLLVLPTVTLKDHTSLVGKVDIILCSPAHYLGAVKDFLYSVKEKTLNLCDSKKGVYSYADAVKSKGSSSLSTDSEMDAVYLHSGGTGGAPKTIRLSSRAINALCEKGESMLCDNPKGKYMLAVLPMFHGFGLAMGVHALLSLGGCDTLMPKFRTDETISLIKRGKINYIIGVPTLYEALLNKQKFSGKELQNLRRAFVGGDFVPSRLVTEFNNRMQNFGSDCRLYEGYGLTETVTVCAVNTTRANKTGSIGKAVEGIEIAVFDGASKLPPNCEGEICVSGDTLMSGYLSGGEVFFESEGKTFVRSGDIGLIDEEGFIFFRSRIKRIAKVSGVTVFPSEIENLCMNEMSEIAEACALSTPSKRSGEEIVMFVALKEKPSEETREAVSKKITDLVESRLSKFASPTKVFFLPALPKTLVGKVDSNKLKEIYL